MEINLRSISLELKLGIYGILALHSYTSFSFMSPVALPSPSLSLIALSSHSLLRVPLFGLEYSISWHFWFAFWVSLVRFSVSLSLVRCVLFSPIFLCSHCLCGFIHSFFAFSGFDRIYLGPFAFTGFALTVSKRYVFLYLKYCCIICMSGVLSVWLYHRFWVSRILGRKNFKWS